VGTVIMQGRCGPNVLRDGDRLPETQRPSQQLSLRPDARLALLGSLVSPGRAGGGGGGTTPITCVYRLLYYGSVLISEQQLYCVA